MTRTTSTTEWVLSPVPDRLQAARRERGLESDADLARAAGRNRNLIASVTQCRASPSDRTAAAIAKALGCHPGQLFTWVPTKIATDRVP